MLDKILVLDMDTYGSISIARKLRSQRIYCKILPGGASLADVVEQDASGIIWVGGAEGESKYIDERILSLDIPLLAIGSASVALARMLGGASHGAMLTNMTAAVSYDPQVIFEGVTPGDRWFSRAERLEISGSIMPIASANSCVVAFCDKERPLYGFQFVIEKHDPDGVTLLKNFCTRICRCTPWWSTEAFIERATGELSRISGDKPLVVALSGGVDSTVCSALAQRAVGNRLKPIMVRTGLHRSDIEKQVDAFCRQNLGIELIVVDAHQKVFEALKGKLDSASKSDTVRQVFRASVLEAAGDEASEMTLVLGTNYTEVLVADHSSHQRMEFKGFKGVVEPLVELFKDEVRAVGESLGLPSGFVHMQPFTLEGLASRIEGEVTEELVETLRAADSIFREEIETVGQDKRLQQYFIELGRMIGDPTRHSLVLKALATGDKAGAARLPFDLLERVVERVKNDLPCIGRVLYDLTPKPSY
ncbi:GMP synthase [glutamine-hydrolyzing] [Clostridia bacterium]|nr:GMP synthase [glutamine-hydrolyzing] [Clostridia bacterium]